MARSDPYYEHRSRQGGRNSYMDYSYIGLWGKYTMFFINFIIWIVGAMMVGIGMWAFVDKFNAQGLAEVQNAFDVILDLSIVLMVVGGIIFIISFAGCIGALRENTTLLAFYSITITLIFFGEVALAVLAFIFPSKILDEIKATLSQEAIEKYRDDDNLRNVIDYVQKEFQCCGLSDQGYKDWNNNIYFNCSESNISVEKCGVPYSCCRNSTNISNDIINTMCGYSTLNKNYELVVRSIYTDGCIMAIQASAQRNLHIVAGVALGVAFAQICVLSLARKLEGEIHMQKARWRH